MFNISSSETESPRQSNAAGARQVMPLTAYNMSPLDSSWTSFRYESNNWRTVSTAPRSAEGTTCVVKNGLLLLKRKKS